MPPGSKDREIVTARLESIQPQTQATCKAATLQSLDVAKPWHSRMMRERPEGNGMLGPDELERYARHIVLREVGGPGQAALKRARVLVIGAGGLGAPALLYLAAAGVGTLGVIDDDTVALSNLQRQVIHGTPDIGMPKVESAAAAIRAPQPACRGRDACRSGSMPATRSTSSAATTSWRTARTILPRATSCPTPAFSRRSRWSPRRSASSTARSPPSGRTSVGRRQAQSDLSLPVSRAAAARHRAGLRRGRHPRRADGRASGR